MLVLNGSEKKQKTVCNSGAEMNIIREATDQFG